jgi:hypothetical protein
MARFLVVDDDPSTVKAMTLLLSARSVSHEIAGARRARRATSPELGWPRPTEDGPEVAVKLVAPR